MPKVIADLEVETPKKKISKEDEILIKRYDNPGQWLGNKHPITRIGK